VFPPEPPVAILYGPGRSGGRKGARVLRGEANPCARAPFWHLRSSDGRRSGKTIAIERTAPLPPDVPKSDQVIVIGIAKDVTSGLVYSKRDATMIYFPTSISATRALFFLIRGKDDELVTTRKLETALAASVPDKPVIATSLGEMFVTQTYPFRAAAWIASLLGGTALLLTLSGMYGVLSYLVGQRTKEIGIRMALGATPGGVVRLILGRSFKFALWGVGVGLVLASRPDTQFRTRARGPTRARRVRSAPGGP
jgi:hypothetical protein